MALATLFQDIGVNDAAEARAVIHKILNKKTSDLTPQQQGMLGTGIYRDISDELDILDAAGNPITRTSTVTLPSGEKMESKFSASPAAGDAPQNNNVQQDNNAEEDNEPLSREEQLRALLDYISGLSDDEFAEVMGYDDKSSMFNAWSRIGSGYAPTWGSDILGDSQTDGEFGILGSGGIRWHLLPNVSPVLTQDMVIQAILDDLNRRIDREEVVDPNEEDTDLTGSKTAEELELEKYTTAFQGMSNAELDKILGSKDPLDLELRELLDKALLRGGGFGIKVYGEPGGRKTLIVNTGIPFIKDGVLEIDITDENGNNVFASSAATKIGEMWEEIRGLPQKFIDKANEILGTLEDVKEINDVGDIIGISGEIIGSIFDPEFEGVFDPSVWMQGEWLKKSINKLNEQWGSAVGSGGSGGSGGNGGVVDPTLADLDGDNIPDIRDNDIDGDGVPNDQDFDPRDPTVTKDPNWREGEEEPDLVQPDIDDTRPTIPCFIAGTKVFMADGSTKNIENIEVGDNVKAKDQKTDTVVHVYDIPVDTRQLWTINNKVTATEAHPFLTKDGWKSNNPKASKELYKDSGLSVAQLNIGDEIITETGTEEVKTLEHEEKVSKVYNFTTETTHTYIVEGFVTHNKTPAGNGNGVEKPTTNVPPKRNGNGGVVTKPPTTSCFIVGTPVNMADGSLKNIETIEVGDKVLTHEGAEDSVVFVYDIPKQERTLWTINNRITTTEAHPFLTENSAKEYVWKSNNPEASKPLYENYGFNIEKLSIGDKLVTLEGLEEVKKLTSEEKDVKVYNFTTEKTHTYLVDGVAAHNKTPSGNGNGIDKTDKKPFEEEDDDDDDDPTTTTTTTTTTTNGGGGGGGGGGGMFSGGDQYFDQSSLAYNPFNPVPYQPKDYNVALDRIMKESLFSDFNVA